ncbi:hypothetical protein SteCoe_8506 [Stentor coeruleus]|uniref:Carboxypeptidase n=1 Tax=Stentor coeruleus TaxID=5963 RepID=A0A1R2CK34_9CILI|nr:hypothetical protein SteCoe_8506 [Stentor coeruleus]
MLISLVLITLAQADTDGPWSLLGASGYAGEIVVNSTSGSSLFYWQFNAIDGNIEHDKLPLIMWMQGGPGCSGEAGMLGERISPIYIDDNAQPHFNNNTWAKHYHLISVDYPYGAGFSYATNPSDYKNSTAGASSYLYTFLQILAKKYPNWFNRDFYIFGESYAGHWVPGIAYKILTENQSAKVTGVIPLPLKGIAMGDPMCDALYQTQNYGDVAFDLGLVNRVQNVLINLTESQIAFNIKGGNYVAANNYLNDVENDLETYSYGVNLYNMRTYAMPDMGDYPDWLANSTTKDMLHVPSNINWVDCNNDVYNAFSADITAGFVTNWMPSLLSNMRVMVYNGQDDLIINTRGVENWFPAINWPYMSNFLKSRKVVWRVQGNIAGYAQEYSNMTFVIVQKAGHFSPYDQPTAVLNMVTRFINGEGWN